VWCLAEIEVGNTKNEGFLKKEFCISKSAKIKAPEKHDAIEVLVGYICYHYYTG
jgi:hypothetical protein